MMVPKLASSSKVGGDSGTYLSDGSVNPLADNECCLLERTKENWWVTFGTYHKDGGWLEQWYLSQRWFQYCLGQAGMARYTVPI